MYSFGCSKSTAPSNLHSRTPEAMPLPEKMPLPEETPLPAEDWMEILKRELNPATGKVLSTRERTMCVFFVQPTKMLLWARDRTVGICFLCSWVNQPQNLTRKVHDLNGKWWE